MLMYYFFKNTLYCVPLTYLPLRTYDYRAATYFSFGFSSLTYRTTFFTAIRTNQGKEGKEHQFQARPHHKNKLNPSPSFVFHRFFILHFPFFFFLLTMEYQRNEVMMTAIKRSPEDLVNERIKSEQRPSKRPRTAKFISAAEEFARKQQTCRFFMDELLDSVIPSSPSSLSKDCNDFNGVEVYSSLLTNLQKQTEAQEDEFCIRCETLRANADDAIRLHESFHCTVKAIEARKQRDGCHLPLLDQGVETNEMILGMVKGFAGVESDESIQDWELLRSVLPSTNC